MKIINYLKKLILTFNYKLYSNTDITNSNIQIISSEIKIKKKNHHLYFFKI